MYRLTPNTITGLADHNSADILGDLGFVLEQYLQAQRCRPPYNTAKCFLGNEPLLGRFRVAFDTRYGPYLRCNPANLRDPSSPTGWDPAGRVNLSQWVCAFGDPPPKNAWSPRHTAGCGNGLPHGPLNISGPCGAARLARRRRAASRAACRPGEPHRRDRAR